MQVSRAGQARCEDLCVEVSCALALLQHCKPNTALPTARLGQSVKCVLAASAWKDHFISVHFAFCHPKEHSRHGLQLGLIVKLVLVIHHFFVFILLCLLHACCP